MPPQESPPAPSASPAPQVRGKARRRALIALAWLFAALIAAFAWLVGTESGARSGLAMLAARLPIKMEAQGVRGRFADFLRLERLAFETTNQQIILTDVRLAWQPWQMRTGVLHVTSLKAARLLIVNKLDQTPEPLHLPDDIALPIALQADDVQVDSGEIAWGPLPPVKLGAFAFDLGFDGMRYTLNLRQFAAQVDAAAGQIAGKFSGRATLDVRKPYALELSLASGAQTSLRQQTFGVQGRLHLQGSLEQMQASLDLGVNDARLQGTARLMPFSVRPFSDARISSSRLDLHGVDPRLPQTALDLELAADDQGRGHLSVANRRAGALNAGRVPFDNLRIDFTQQAGRFQFGQIKASYGAASIGGAGSYGDGALTLALVAAHLNLHEIDRQLQPTSLAGTISLQHAAGKQLIDVDLQQPVGKRSAAIQAHAEIADARIAIERANLQLGSGRAELSGSWELAGKQGFAAQGRISRLRLQDLGDFAQWPATDLSGSFSVKGARQPQWTIDAAFRITDSTIAAQRLHGEGQAQLRADRLHLPRLQLIAGDNRLEARGELTPAGGQLTFALDAPQLEQLGSGFAGQLKVSGSAGGSFRQPRIRMQWRASGLRAIGRAQIDAMQGDADLVAGAGQPNAPLAINMLAQGLALGQLRAREARIAARGTTAAHVIDASLTEERQNWSAKAEGGVRGGHDGAQWQGLVRNFNAAGRFNGSLSAPAALTVAAKRIQLRQARFTGEAFDAVIDIFERDIQGIVTRGSVTRFQAARFLKFASADPALSTDLLLAGTWDISIADTVNGQAHVYRQSGDLTMKSSMPIALGLQQLEAKASADRGRLSLRFDAAGHQLGRIALHASAAAGSGATRFAITPHAPLAGKLTLDVPSLAWAGALVSPTIMTAGSVQGEVNLAGTAAEPRVEGALAGNQLRVFFTDLGLDLAQGSLAARFQNNRLQVENLSFQSSQGRITASGPVQLGVGSTEARIAVKAEHFAVLNRSDRKLVVSGQAEIGWQERALVVRGAVGVDGGYFDLGRPDMPQLSDDVVVVGQAPKPPAHAAATIDLGVDFGQGVALSGRGLDGILTGKLRLQAQPRQLLRAHGTLEVVKGTYTAYGRKLKIERGELRFNGPLNNPALDILAMRRGQEVEAGVAVRGTILAPRATLVSEPSVPEAEKLSWLVLGHGLSALGEGDIGSLQSAAGALLSEGAAGSVQARLAAAVGLDTLSVGTSQNNVEQRIVTLGKQVSERLYLGYEQGLESASSVLHLRYALSRRLTVEAEAGARSAVSLFFNFVFD